MKKRIRIVSIAKEELPQVKEVSPLAWERTRGFLENFEMMEFDLRVLAASCYLQGLRDAAEAMESKGMLKC